MNCKPGDLAICISSSVPDNVGKIFKILEWRDHVKMWVAEAQNGFAITSQYKIVRKAYIHDSRLMPISGTPQED